MSFVERFVILCPYLGESSTRDSIVHVNIRYQKGIETVYSVLTLGIRKLNVVLIALISISL